MLKATRRRKILKLYTENPEIAYEQIALLVDCSDGYVTQCIRDYHIDQVSYYNFCLAPSLADPDVYFLFSDNGVEKVLKFKNNIVYPQHDLTPLEELYISLNLSRNIESEKKNFFI